MMFTQSDMHLSNFGVDEQGKMVLMDSAEIGPLPETLVAYTMSAHDGSLADSGAQERPSLMSFSNRLTDRDLVNKYVTVRCYLHHNVALFLVILHSLILTLASCKSRCQLLGSVE
jgi:predicted unusual protein kinase regulating ubiquinone biosynthesis (AarF/ABC1/UbiB family)